MRFKSAKTSGQRHKATIAQRSVARLSTVVRWAGLAVALAIAVPSVGCGGDEANSAGSGEQATLTKAEFIEEANEACRKERAGLERELAEFRERLQPRGLPSGELNARLAHRVLLQTIEMEIFRIESLDAPPSEEQKIDDMVSAERLEIDKLANMDRIASLDVVDRAFAESGRELRAYGLSECANGPGTRG